jgi:hypothetical protein
VGLAHTVLAHTVLAHTGSAHTGSVPAAIGEGTVVQGFLRRLT